MSKSVMQKRIHFIGICGVAMSALALAFKKQGWKVTGSDAGFYPPVSTHLKDAGVDFYPGWHAEKVLKNFKDGGDASEIVVVGNVAGSQNPEWLYAQEHKLNIKSYPEIIKEYFVKRNSIVCAGTYGKSTSTALLTWIFKEAGFEPSYMFGGLMVTPPYPPLKRGGNDNTPPFKEGLGGGKPTLPSANITNPDATVGAGWSVVEGDEYKASRWDNGPKFSYYSPTHLLLTSVTWDHADVYPTEQSYLDVFKKLVSSVPKNGLKIISEKALPVILSGAKNLSQQRLDPSVAPLPQDDNDNTRESIVTYGKTAGCDYVYTNVAETTDGVSFDILFKNEKYSVSTSCLGEYMADNATGCFALARECGLEAPQIIKAIKNFKGMKRRLEKRLAGKITVFDTIAHSPTKAQADISSLRQVYKNKIIAVFEPNAGNREHAAVPGYAHAFTAASEVIIPRLTKIKHKKNEPAPIDGQELTNIILQTHGNARYIEEDENLVNYIAKKIQPGDVVVFLGSHGFRGMIENLISQLSS